MNSYPITFDVDRQSSMSRAHLFLRLFSVILISGVVGASGGLFLIYLAVPVTAAIFIAKMGGDRYVGEGGERTSRWLATIIGLLAYLAFLTDELPSDHTGVQLRVISSGSPTVSSALMRLVQAIPSALLFALLNIISGIVGFVAASSILIFGHCPEGCWKFQLGVVRWEARLLGYMASIVETYPSFSFDPKPAN